MLIRFLLAFIVVLFGPSAALAADPYTVANLHVDAQASNALEAQTMAISQGQGRAANLLINRMSLAAERTAKGFVGVTDQDGAKMIRALEIANEKRSASRYLGDITVAFNQNAVSQYMRAKGLTLITSQARERLVIPLLEGEVMWSGNAWEQAWENSSFINSLTPMQAITPRPDLEQYFEDQTGANISLKNLRAIGNMFGVEQILIVAARETFEGYSVSAKDIALDRGTARPFKTIKGSSAMQAAQAIAERIEEDWKASAISSISAKNVLLPVSVLYKTHSQWQELQTAINGAAQIRAASLKAISKRGALMTLTFGGDMEKLRNELAYKGVSLKEDGEMGVVLFKTGSF